MPAWLRECSVANGKLQIPGDLWFQYSLLAVMRCSAASDCPFTRYSWESHMETNQNNFFYPPNMSIDTGIRNNFGWDDRNIAFRSEEKKKKLSGAAKRRLKCLLEEGIRYERAIKLCLLPMAVILNELPPTALKTIRADYERLHKPNLSEHELLADKATEASASKRMHSPDNEATFSKMHGSNNECTSPKRHSSHNATTTEISADDTSDDSCLVAIFNKIPMNETQIQILRNSIVSEIDKIGDEGPQPRFLRSRMKSGWLNILCADRNSRDWLAGIACHLKPWPDAELTLENREIVYKPITVDVVIPGEILSNDLILSRLKKQNRSLNTSRWQVLSSVSNEDGQTLTINIDRASDRVLQKLKYRPYWNLMRVQFQLNTEKRTEAPDSFLDLEQQSDCITEQRLPR